MNTAFTAHLKIQLLKESFINIYWDKCSRSRYVESYVCLGWFQVSCEIIVKDEKIFLYLGLKPKARNIFILKNSTLHHALLNFFKLFLSLINAVAILPWPILSYRQNSSTDIFTIWVRNSIGKYVAPHF